MKTQLEHSMEETFNLPESTALVPNPSENLPAVIEEPTKPAEVFEDPIVKDAEEDFAQARERIKNISKMGEDALDDMIALATVGESARMFEAAAAMAKVVLDTNRRLLELHKDRKELIRKDVQIVPGKTNIAMPGSGPIENAVFVGTTAELQALITNRNGDKPVIDVTPELPVKEADANQ